MSLNNNLVKYLIIFFAIMTRVECGVFYRMIGQFATFNLLYYSGFYPKTDKTEYYIFQTENSTIASISIPPSDKLFLNTNAMELLANLIKSVATNLAYAITDDRLLDARANAPVVVHAPGKYYFFDVQSYQNLPGTLSFHMNQYQSGTTATGASLVYGVKNVVYIASLTDITEQEQRQISGLQFKSMHDDTSQTIDKIAGLRFQDNTYRIKVNVSSDKHFGEQYIEIDRKVYKYLLNMKQGSDIRPLVLEREGTAGLTNRHIIIFDGSRYIVQSSFYYHTNQVSGNADYILDQCGSDIIFSTDKIQAT